jgi:methyltransferase (TIGR00027 family)
MYDEQGGMVEAAPSTTAMMAAVTRGAHRFEDARPWILDDPFALMLVGPAWREIEERLRSRFPERVLRQARAGIALRSKYAEQRLTQGPFAQYVMLGAGLDSFAWRYPDLVGVLRVFEVDHPASQAWKYQRVIELGLPVHDSHVFAPVDFENESLREGLDAAGFDWARPTIFSWLGVTTYLTVDAIEATLRTLASCVTSSEVVFTYAPGADDADDDWREFVEILAPIAAAAGEPVQPGWSPADIDTLIGRCGLRLADHPNHEELISRYFADRTDGLKPFGARLVAATVP